MGHVESGGEAAGSRTDELWALWRRLKAYFPVWSLLPSSFVTPGAWGYMGVDFVSGFRRNPSTLKTFELLEGVPPETFDALSALANLNARRQDQMLRAIVIAYLTVPISVLALLAEVAGDSMLSFAREHWQMTVQLGTGLTLAPVAYFLGQWRSRQIVGVLDLIRIERAQSPYTALELRED
jgi:hypothetical protein